MSELSIAWNRENRKFEEKRDINSLEEFEEYLINKGVENRTKLILPSQKMMKKRIKLMMKREYELNCNCVGAFALGKQSWVFGFKQDFSTMKPYFIATGARVEEELKLALYEAATFEYLDKFYDLLEQQVESATG
jgi:hypothetical protein